MTAYTGTNGNDTLTGTNVNDTFSPLLGQDSVDGQGGIDTLTVNYSTVTSGATSQIYANGSGGFNGYFWTGPAPSLNNYVYLYNIEKIIATLSGGDDTFYIDASPLATAGTTVSINASAGFDTLVASFSSFTGTTFTQAAGGVITSNHGTYSNFEQFALTLGGGTNTVTTQGGADYIYATNGGTSTISTGAGDDYISSTGGVDHVDGGAGSDSWYGDYSASVTGLTFSFNGTTGAGTLSNGTTLAGIEGGTIFGGTGNDSFTIVNNPNFGVYGGDGSDTLNRNDAGLSGLYYYNYFSDNGAGGFNGSIGNTAFNGIENLNVTLSDDDNYAVVDTAPLASGATLNLNGGAGFDTLQAAFSAFANTTFTVDGLGAITSNHGTYASFEQFNLTLGGGTNTVTTQGGADYIYATNGGTNTISTGAGDDVIWSTGGVDHVDGGTGTNYWYGDYSAATTDLAFSFDGATGTGTLSNGTTLAGIEGGSIYGGAGNDSFTIVNNPNFTVNGGGGHDTFIRNDAGVSNVYYASFLNDQGNGTFSGSIGNTAFNSIANVNLTMSDDDNVAYLNAAPLALGATLNLNGGGGFDLLQADFSAFANTIFSVDGAGAITSNHGTYSNFEQFNLTLGSGTNTVTTQGGGDQIHAQNGGTNTISTGSGYDFIYSTGGVDHVDGGSDIDWWYGDYTTTDSNQTFNFNFNTGAGNLTGGTTLVNIENPFLTLGGGNDQVSLTGVMADGGIDGGAGTDTAILDESGLSKFQGLPSVISASGAGSFYVNINNYANYGYLTNFEHVTVKFTTDDNYVVVDTAPLASGATLNLDGGIGFDTLQIDFSAFANTTFTENGVGAISSNHGTYASFEQFNLTLGGGTNTVTTQGGTDTIYAQNGGTSTISTGAGDDVIWSTGGVVHLDGGAGTDNWHADYSAVTTDQTFSFNGNTGSGSQTGGTTLSNIEGVYLTLGDGNDTVNLTGIIAYDAHIDAGAGNNTLVANEAGSTYPYHNSYITSDGAGGFTADLDSYNGYGYLTKFQHVTVTFSDDDNYIYVDATSTLTGATLSLDGGIGDDTVQVNGVSGDWTIVANGSGGFVLTDINAADGNHGSFTIRSVEHIQFDDTTIDTATLGAGLTLTGTAGIDTLTGGVGDDTISGLAGTDQLFGLGGNDLLNGGAGNDTIDGGSGTDTATYADATAAVKVSLAITIGQNTGLAGGTDKLVSIENLTGSAFNDTLTGNGGDNVIDGLAGNNTMVGGAGNDTIIGGAGTDKLDGGLDVDTLIGGAGSDTYTVDNTSDVVTELVGGGTADLVNAKVSFALSANVEKLTLTGALNIEGTGNELANTLTGNTGNNQLFGLAGKDAISGGTGDDTISGGLGADTLTGGTGADHFRFDVIETATNKDTIKDFVHGTDKIEIDHSVFAAFAGDPLGALNPLELALGTAATTASQHLVYNAATGALYYDANGVGGAAQIQIALLSTKPVLDASDFLLI